MSVNIKTYKPDGRLHREYTAEVLLETDEWLMVHVPEGSTIIDNIKETHYTQRRDCVGLINNHEYYNVFYEFGRAGVFHRIYVNLATPAVWSESRVTWTDLELDIIQTRNDPVYEDDIDEYNRAIKEGYISKEIVAICENNRALLTMFIQEQKFPFARQSFGEVTNRVKRKLSQGAQGRLAFAMLAAIELLPLGGGAAEIL